MIHMVRNRRRIMLGAFMVLLLFVSILFTNTNLIGRWMYPIHYREEIAERAEQHQVDPYLIAAVIRVESNFDPTKVSPKKAQGLMQIMPGTAEWITEIGKFPSQYPSQLEEPATNIDIGTYYLHWLHDFSASMYPAYASMDQQDQYAILLSEYNAGHNKVMVDWLKTGIWDGTVQHIDQIDYSETRHYVKRVLYYYNKYKKIYSDQDFEES